jgi:hypothetical protein
MAELRLRQELEDSKAEIARLRERLVTTLPTVYKDLSPISIVPKWSGAETDTPLSERRNPFFRPDDSTRSRKEWRSFRDEPLLTKSRHAASRIRGQQNSPPRKRKRANDLRH